MSDTTAYTLSVRPLTGDAGPCSHALCKERATIAADIQTNELNSRVFVCDAHRKALPK